MAKTRDLPLATYPVGTRTFVKQTPNGLAGFNIAIGRCTTATPTLWPSASSTLSILVECSYDGGLTFPVNGGSASMTDIGGIKTNSRNGEEIAESIFSASFSPVEPNAIRVTATINGGSIRTYVDVTVL